MKTHHIPAVFYILRYTILFIVFALLFSSVANFYTNPTNVKAQVEINKASLIGLPHLESKP